MTGDLVHHPLDGVMFGAVDRLRHVGVGRQPVGDLVPAGEETPGQLAAPAVDHGDEAIRAVGGRRSGAAPAPRRSGCRRHRTSTASRRRRSPSCPVAYTSLIRSKSSSRPDFLEDHLEPLGHERFQGVDARDATGLGHPAVDAATAVVEDAVHGRSTADAEFGGEVEDFRGMVQTAHSFSRNSFTPS